MTTATLFEHQFERTDATIVSAHSQHCGDVIRMLPVRPFSHEQTLQISCDAAALRCQVSSAALVR